MKTTKNYGIIRVKDNRVTGLLRPQPDGTFRWDGYSETLRGARYNYGAFVHFNVVGDDWEILDSNGKYPSKQDLLKATKEL